MAARRTLAVLPKTHPGLAVEILTCLAELGHRNEALLKVRGAWLNVFKGRVKSGLALDLRLYLID
jgi:hypothetical protein